MASTYHPSSGYARWITHGQDLSLSRLSLTLPRPVLPRISSSQPYDKITPEMQERYYEVSPYNFARIIKGKAEPADGDSDNVYTRAAASLSSWIAQGVLEQEVEAAF